MTLAAPARTYSVLLVDDMPALRVLVRVVLEASGSFVVIGEASNGVQAIDLAGALQPDLVLLDLSMPRMDGLEALPGIRQSSPDSTIVVLSGFESGQVAELALERGAQACLEKGIPAELLAERLLEILEA